MRHYSIRRRLLHKDTDKTLTDTIVKVSYKIRTKALLGTGIYLLSIPLAYVNVYFAYFCLIIPPLLYFIPEGIDNEELAEKVAEKNM